MCCVIKLQLRTRNIFRNWIILHTLVTWNRKIDDFDLKLVIWLVTSWKNWWLEWIAHLSRSKKIAWITLSARRETKCCVQPHFVSDIRSLGCSHVLVQDPISYVIIDRYIFIVGVEFMNANNIQNEYGRLSDCELKEICYLSTLVVNLYSKSC